MSWKNWAYLFHFAQNKLSPQNSYVFWNDLTSTEMWLGYQSIKWGGSIKDAVDEVYINFP